MLVNGLISTYATVDITTKFNEFDSYSMAFQWKVEEIICKCYHNICSINEREGLGKKFLSKNTNFIFRI